MVAESLLDRHYPPEPGSVAEARAAAIACAKDNGATDMAAEAVALGVSEAVTNVVLHAYRDQTPDDLRVTIECLDDAELMITVADNGGGMAPRMDSPGLGVGLALIGQVSDAMEVRSVDGGGTEVCMRFSLDG